MHAVVFDIDGDRFPEFVVLEDDEREATDALTGRRHWLSFDENCGP